MKNASKKLLILLTCLLAAVLMLVACSETGTPAESGAETTQGTSPAGGTEASAVTGAADTENTETNTGDTAPTTVETQAKEPQTTEPVDASTQVSDETDAILPTDTQPEGEDTASDEQETEVLSADDVLKILTDALANTEKQTAHKMVVDTQMRMAEADMGGSRTTEITDGVNFIYINEANGMTDQTVVLADRAYFLSDYGDGELNLTLVTLDETQRNWVISQFNSESSDDGEEDFQADQFKDLSGVRYADGTVLLTAQSFSDELMEAFQSSMGLVDGMGMELTLKLCQFHVSADGLLTGMDMDFAMGISMEDEGVSVDYSIDVLLRMTAEYEDVTVEAPENAEDYVENTFNGYFMLTPPEGEADFAGLPLDGDNYVIGAEDSEFSADDQYMILWMYPCAYENKTFVIHGTIGLGMESETPVIYVGEYGMLNFQCAEGVDAPAIGDRVVMTATFEHLVEGIYDDDFENYTLKVTACEVQSNVNVGPNGGTIMYVTASSLNVRSAPDATGDNVVGSLANGESVEVLETGLGTDGTWAKIFYECEAGYAYVSTGYLSELQP